MIGLGRCCGCRCGGREHWNTAGNAYRIRLFGSASWPKGEDRASLDPPAFAEVLNAGGDPVEILRCRVRYFTEGVALGTIESKLEKESKIESGRSGIVIGILIAGQIPNVYLREIFKMAVPGAKDGFVFVG